MRDRFPLVLIGGLVLLGALGSALMQGAKRGAFADQLSTYRSERNGARALYLLLEQGGAGVGRTQQSFEAIEHGQNLFLLGTSFAESHEGLKSKTGFTTPKDGGSEDDEDEALSDEEKEDLKTRGLNAMRAPPISEDETEKLLEHIQDGATVVYLPRRATSNELLRATGVSLTTVEKELDLRTLVPAQPGPFTRGVERVEARVTSFLDLPERAFPLLVDERLDLVAAAVVPYGQGRLIVIGAPELAMNQALARADNAQLWRALVRQVNRTGIASFDEYHHGFSGERSMGAFAARYGLQYAVAQLLLGVILWAASLRRFGRPRAPKEELRIGATDALSATSRLYREGKHFAHAAQCIVKELAAELAPLVGASPRASPAELGAALELHGRKELSTALLSLASSAQAAQRDADVFEVASRAALVRSTLQHHRKKRIVR